MVNTRSKTKKTKKTVRTCISQASIEDSDRQSIKPVTLVGSNDDLLTEILLRLPVTSILRFKSVSKHWRLLLSDRHFTHRYDKLSKSPGVLLGDIYVPFDAENPGTPPYSSLQFYIKGPRVEIKQYCNGLLLCCSYPRGRGRYYVFNPTTKQFAIIPSPPLGNKVCKKILFMALAFHQTDCVHYEVVCIHSLVPHEKKFQFQIYSSLTKRWRLSIECSSRIVPSSFRDAVYWNGAIHWASFAFSSNFTCNYCSYWCFKTDGELLQKLPLPEESMSSDILAGYFGESRGHLHLIVYEIREGKRLHMNVYEMLRDYSQWFVKYQVQPDELLAAFPEMIYPSGHYNFRVVDVIRGDEEEDTFIVLKIEEKIMTYNVHHKSFKHIFSFPSFFLPDSPRFHRYTETLTYF